MNKVTGGSVKAVKHTKTYVLGDVLEGQPSLLRTSLLRPPEAPFELVTVSLQQLCFEFCKLLILRTGELFIARSSKHLIYRRQVLPIFDAHVPQIPLGSAGAVLHYEHRIDSDFMQ